MQMIVDILASGSGGNCIALRSGPTTILIDIGIAKTKVEKRLLESGIWADKITAIFITHAHKDHCKGLPLANKYKIPVYAGEEEWKDIEGVDEGLRCTLVPNEPISMDMGEFGVIPFKVHHDAYDPLGYIVTGSIKASICLDTGKVDSEMIKAMKDSDIYIIEANHDPAMVEAGDYPNSVKSRILSDIGHLSNDQTAAALQRLIRGQGERIYLTHLSKKNNMPALAEMTVKAALKQRGFKAKKHYQIEVI